MSVVVNGAIFCVTGNIGAGKSTFAKAFAARLRECYPSKEVIHIAEQVDPFFLARLYASHARNNLAAMLPADESAKLLAEKPTHLGIVTYFQTEKQHSRWRHVIEAKEARARGALVVLDTDPRHDAVFARANLDAYALGLYEQLFRLYHNEIGFTPDVRIFIDVTPELCHKHIGTRAGADPDRSCESAITVDYLRLLDEQFHASKQFGCEATFDVEFKPTADSHLVASDVVNDLVLCSALPIYDLEDYEFGHLRSSGTVQITQSPRVAVCV